jgi:hypothetical protein
MSQHFLYQQQKNYLSYYKVIINLVKIMIDILLITADIAWYIKTHFTIRAALQCCLYLHRYDFSFNIASNDA